MRFKETIQNSIATALSAAGFEPKGVPLVLEQPRLKAHGDIATPIALSLAKVYKRNPMEIAEAIAGHIEFPDGVVDSVDVARPGYLNLRFAAAALTRNLDDIRERGDGYGHSDYGKGLTCQVEYVSANPTGPLVVVSARAAAVGSVLVNLLSAIGYDAEGEYYVNDYGKQVEALGNSLRFRVRERKGQLDPGEELGAYPGSYITDIAAKVSDEDAAEWEKGEAASLYGRFAASYLLHGIEEDLLQFGVRFNNFFRESSLHPDAVDNVMRLVEEKGYAFVDENAVYFRTTAFGDEKDRVLVKSDGKPTYFLGDIAYHQTKLQRGYNRVIDLLGPDHHGHIPRIKAAAAVLGAEPDWLETMVVGWVRLMQGKKPVSMSKRAGEIIMMRELIEDVGADVAKYFFLMRRANAPLDFDLELARKQSDENPVYYVQYAHARIASVTRFAKEKRPDLSDAEGDMSRLVEGEERDLMVQLLFFPYAVESAALAREPHRLTTYARELATLFHQFYHACRIVTDDDALTLARLRLAESTQQVLRNTLHLLGVGAPSSM